MPESTPAIVRDADFYFELIFIRVEDTIFKIPKHYITQISIFSTVFTLPPGKDGIEGATEETPLVLHELSKKDFKAFLSVLVPLEFPPNYSKMSVEMWISTLRLSTMWEVTAVRDLAVKNLTKLIDAVAMINLGTELHVSQWVISGCHRLIARKHGPTKEECDDLGIDFAVQIYGLREHMLTEAIPSAKGPGSREYQSEYQRIVTNLVREKFPDRITVSSTV